MVEQLLIGITGHFRAGKDTLGRILVDRHGATRLAWADEVRRELWEAFGRALLRERGLPSSFEDWVAWLEARKADPPDSPDAWVRPLMQWWGTEYRRQRYGQDYWIRKLAPALRPGAVVTDCRFPNEASAILERGGVMIRVDRPGCDGDGHESERHIDSLPVDVVLDNSGGIPELRDMLEAALPMLAAVARARKGIR